MSAGAITLSDINSADWSLALDSSEGGTPGAGIGNVVQGMDDVNQCIGIILTTPKGSDPLRPTFACDLWQYIDRPINSAVPAIVREVYNALSLWEPRIRVLSVSAAPIAGNIAGLTVTVQWQLALGTSSSPQTATIQIPGTLNG